MCEAGTFISVGAIINRRAGTKACEHGDMRAKARNGTSAWAAAAAYLGCGGDLGLTVGAGTAVLIGHDAGAGDLCHRDGHGGGGSLHRWRV